MFDLYHVVYRSSRFCLYLFVLFLFVLFLFLLVSLADVKYWLMMMMTMITMVMEIARSRVTRGDYSIPTVTETTCIVFFSGSLEEGDDAEVDRVN